MASNKYPRLSFDNLATMLDYTRFPPAIDAVPISSIRKETREYVDSGIEKALQDASESNGKLRVLNICYADNGRELVSYTSYPGDNPPRSPLVRSSHLTRFVDSLGDPLEAEPVANDNYMHNCGFTPDALHSTSLPVAEIHRRVTEASQDCRKIVDTM